jgi:sRNA-binding protein
MTEIHLQMPDSPPSPTTPPPAAPRPAPTDCAPQLKQLFPALFTGAPKPVKLRIQIDIQERAPGAFSKQALSAFFRRYTGSTSYLNAVAHGKQRFDLDGQPSGEITDEHRQVARDELSRRRANQEQRVALEEEQRHNRARLLHDFERTTLTRANFCALKAVADEELDGLLAIAREEAVGPQRAAVPQRAPNRRR